VAKVVEVPSEALDFIRRNGRFLISSHVNPDGDGIGAAMALKWAVLKLGKEAQIVIDSPAPSTFDYFENYHWVKTPETAVSLGKFSRVITADVPSMERLGRATDLIAEGAQILVIDHHITGEVFGHINYIDESASASCEMILTFIKALGLAPDATVAEYLYTGIVIDTGRFRFSNTTPNVLKAGAELVTAGADPAKVSERIFFSNTYETTMALGRMVESIRLHHGGKTATASFPLSFIQSDEWKKVDTEGFVNHPLAINGVEVAVLFKEPKPGVTRASLRAKRDIDVNEIARVFGGGGHAKASGCTINAPLKEAEEILLAEIEKRYGAAG
jgi:phosphoesterase RecJ-like protein